MSGAPTTSGLALGRDGKIDQRLAHLVGRLHQAASDPVDGGLPGAHSRANALFGQPSSTETFNGE